MLVGDCHESLIQMLVGAKHNVVLQTHNRQSISTRHVLKRAGRGIPVELITV